MTSSLEKIGEGHLKESAMPYSTEYEGASERVWLHETEFPLYVNRHHVTKMTEPRRCYHRELEFQFFLSGQQALFVKDGIYRCRKNSVLLIHPDEVHHFIPKSSCAFETQNLVLLPKLLQGRTEALSILQRLSTYYHVMLSEKEMTMAALSLREIEDELTARSSHWQSMICSNVERVLIMLERAATRGAIQPPVENAFSRDIISYLEEHFAESLTLYSMAELWNSSPWKLCRTFKKHIGLGFQEYLIHRRIIEARKWLEESDLKISSVANKVGFTDLSAFNRNFRLITGLTPSSYRKLSS